MALIDMKKLVVVLALAILAGACAQKSVRVETPADPVALQTELEDVRQKRDGLEREELELRKQKPVRTEELVRVRAEQIRLSGREAVILDQLGRLGDSATKQARRQLRKEASLNARNDRHNAKALRDAAIEGCTPGTVEVKAYGQNFDLFAIFPPTAVIRVTNHGDAPAIISTAFKGYGTVVRNLCPGGSVTVSFKLESFDSQSVQFPVTVSSVKPNGQPYYESRNYYLDKYMANYQRVRYDDWPFNTSR